MLTCSRPLLSVGFLVGSIAIGYMADKYNWHLLRGFPILRLEEYNFKIIFLSYMDAFWSSNLFYFIINKLLIYFILKKSFREFPLLCTLSKFIFFISSAIKIYTHCLGEHEEILFQKHWKIWPTLNFWTVLYILSVSLQNESQVMVFISMHKSNVLNSDLTDSHLFLFFLSDTAEWKAS